MTNEYQPQFEDFLAQAATPEEIESGQVEPTHDPAKSLKTGLEKLFLKYLRKVEKQLSNGLIDMEKADVFVTRIDQLSLSDLGYEVSKSTSIERAKKIMGPGSYFGKEEVENVFEFEINEKIPHIPFSEQELTKAKELGQFLIIRISETPDGQPLTMQNISLLLQPQFDLKRKGKILYTPRRPNIRRPWYESEEFFITRKLNLEWALTTSRLVPESNCGNFLEQTGILAKYLKNQVFNGIRMPKIFIDAIAQFETSKEEIIKLVDIDLPTALFKLSQLQINQLTRQSAVEALYDDLIYNQNMYQHIFELDYIWTKDQAADNAPICVGVTDIGSDASISIGGELIIDNPPHDISAIFSRTK